jgi:hypothetical protein
MYRLPVMKLNRIPPLRDKTKMKNKTAIISAIQVILISSGLIPRSLLRKTYSL